MLIAHPVSSTLVAVHHVCTHVSCCRRMPFAASPSSLSCVVVLAVLEHPLQLTIPYICIKSRPCAHVGTMSPLHLPDMNQSYTTAHFRYIAIHHSCLFDVVGFGYAGRLQPLGQVCNACMSAYASCGIAIIIPWPCAMFCIACLHVSSHT